MESQSVSATRKAEQRFRIDKPNSKPRAVVLIGLDKPARDLAEALVEAAPERRSFFDLGADAVDAGTAPSWLADLAAKTTALTAAIEDANIAVVIATAGSDAQRAGVIGEACRARGIPMTALVVGATLHSDAAVAATLAHLRPCAAMVVVVGTDAYVADMLHALQV